MNWRRHFDEKYKEKATCIFGHGVWVWTLLCESPV